MRLIEFTYGDIGWNLLPLKFNQRTLLVGENSAGKSRTIEAIQMCADFIVQNSNKHAIFNPSGDFGCEMVFEDEDCILRYAFVYKDSVVEAERLLRIENNTETILLLRDEKSCTVNGIALNPPADKLLIHVRRDKEEYPLFEKIVQWAENTFFLPFAILKEAETRAMIQGRAVLAEHISQFTDEQKNNVIQNAKSIDYHIDDFCIQALGNVKGVIFSEKGVDSPYPFLNMSNGMFRAFYILIVMEYMASHNAPSLMMIDDFCEGLDYDRSVALGKLVFEYCSEHNIDLVVSSNDSFLMDVVPTDNWIILNRNGSEVSNICKATHPDLFEDFSFTGLNNFSLFSSDFIARHQSKHKDEQA